MKALLLTVLLLSSMWSLNFDRAMEQLKVHEGYSAKPYYDSLGHLTIGYGTNLSHITRVEANMLLAFRLNESYMKLYELYWFRALSSNRQQVILNMAYQLGHGGILKFKRMIYNLKRSYFWSAANEMKSSKWYRQSGIRSKQLVRQMRRGW